MKIKIIPEKCIACGLCHSYAPSVFDYHDNGIIKFYDNNSDLEEIFSNESETLKAIKECPTRAIEQI